MIAEALKAQEAKSITFLVREVRSSLEVSLNEYPDYQEYELLINATPYGMKEKNCFSLECLKI